MRAKIYRIGQRIIDLLPEAESADPYLACLLMLTAVGIIVGRTKELVLCCAQALEKPGRRSALLEIDDDGFPPKEIGSDLVS